MRVAFLGPAGTFTEEALRASAPGPCDELPYPSVHEAIMAVEEGAADSAVVPIENSLEGSVAPTLDALAGDAASVRITAEVVHPIRHCLIAREQLALQRVARVVSHPQALAQCAGFLRERLATAERASAPSTAEAVSAIADEKSKPWAAIGSRLAADLYGCALLAEGIEDRDDNLTRFVWLASDRGDDIAGSGERGVGASSKTSVVFWGFNDDSPGSLVTVLREFSDRGINLTKIESRPRRVRLGHYMFFADLDGGEDDPPVAAALESLRSRVETLRILGSYPAAPGASD
jgi:prephenate dehydratase